MELQECCFAELMSDKTLSVCLKNIMEMSMQSHCSNPVPWGTLSDIILSYVLCFFLVGSSALHAGGGPPSFRPMLSPSASPLPPCPPIARPLQATLPPSHGRSPCVPVVALPPACLAVSAPRSFHDPAAFLLLCSVSLAAGQAPALQWSDWWVGLPTGATRLDFCLDPCLDLCLDLCLDFCLDLFCS